MARDRYTLRLESARILEDVAVCEECLTAFQQEEWVEVLNSSARPTPDEE